MEARKDPSGRQFWIHEETGKTQWIAPMVIEVTDDKPPNHEEAPIPAAIPVVEMDNVEGPKTKVNAALVKHELDTIVSVLPKLPIVSTGKPAEAPERHQ